MTTTLRPFTFDRGIYFHRPPTYDESVRTLFRGAGWIWHPKQPNDCCARRQGTACKACELEKFGVWFTTDASRAVLLIEHATAPARAALQGFLTTLEESTAASAEIDIPVPVGMVPYPYQKAGVAFMLRRDRSLLADQMGLGKSPQAIMFLNVRQDVSRVLIVAPKTLGANWEREIHRRLVRDTFRVYVGEIPSTIDVPESRTLVSIVGVEQCRDSEVQASAARFLRSGTSCLIGDEMHRTKNARAQQTRAILGDVREPDPAKQGGIQSHAKYVLLLTGTPIVNGRPIEMWPLLRTCDPTTWTSWRTFYRRYCGGSPTGAAYLEELATKARSSCMIRRLKRDVLPDLPPKTRQVVPIINDEIAELVRQEQLLLKGVVPNVPGAEEEAAYLDNLKSLRDIGPVDITEMSALRKQLAVAKVPLVAEFAEETLESADKVAIYAHHQDVIRDLERRLAAFNPAMISGTTPHDKRMAAVDLFQSDPSCRVFIGSIQAAGVGITLTASNIAIFAELDWTPGVVEQAEDRHHRIGQKDTVSVIHLVADESLDARMALRLIEKQRLNDAATRGRDLAGVPAAQGEADPDMPDVAKVTSKVREALERAPNNAVPELPMPMISDEDKRRVRDIARQLLSVCDGARQQDMSGYSKFDRAFGEKVAQSADMSDRMAVAGARMLQRYHRQIGSASADLMRRIAAVQLPAQQRTST